MMYLGNFPVVPLNELPSPYQVSFQNPGALGTSTYYPQNKSSVMSEKLIYNVSTGKIEREWASYSMPSQDRFLVVGIGVYDVPEFKTTLPIYPYSKMYEVEFYMIYSLGQYGSNSEGTFNIEDDQGDNLVNHVMLNENTSMNDSVYSTSYEFSATRNFMYGPTTEIQYYARGGVCPYYDANGQGQYSQFFLRTLKVSRVFKFTYTVPALTQRTLSCKIDRTAGSNNGNIAIWDAYIKITNLT